MSGDGERPPVDPAGTAASDDSVNPGPSPEFASADAAAEPATEPAGLSETRPPSRRDAFIRIGLVAGVLFIVFGLIMPRFIDYQAVLETLQGLTIRDFLVVGVFGVIAWVLTGAIFTMLIPHLGFVRGTEAYLILTGIGASIPLGPWNMAVLWVVIRGWGPSAADTTGGVLLYGIFDQLSRFGLLVIAGLVLVIAEGLNRDISVATGVVVGCLIVGIVLFVLVGGGLILVVRSERLARKLGRWAERVVGAVIHRLGRASVPDVEGALVRFRLNLGDTIRARGLPAFVVAMISKLAWALLMIVAMRVVGVSAKTLPDAVILGTVAVVFVITVLPISPGGAGVPELLYLSIFSTYTGGADSSAMTAGIMLFRAFQWFLPIPLSWILLGLSRRGRPLLPTRAEFQGSEDPPPSAVGAT